MNMALTVVTLLSLLAVTRHVAVSTTSVALLATSTTGASTIALSTSVAATAKAATTTTLAETAIRRHGAIASDMADLAAAVALLTSSTTSHAAAVASSTAHAATTAVRALTRHVTSLTAGVAWLLLGCFGALAAHMALLTTIVAGWGAFRRTVAGLVGRVAACEASC